MLLVNSSSINTTFRLKGVETNSTNHSEQFSDITLVHLEDDMIFLKHRLVFNGIPESYLFIRSVGYDKAVQDNVGIA